MEVLFMNKEEYAKLVKKYQSANFSSINIQKK